MDVINTATFRTNLSHSNRFNEHFYHWAVSAQARWLAFDYIKKECLIFIVITIEILCVRSLIFVEDFDK